MNTAVILTARKERDSQIPYPLLPIDGKRCLIDRTLQLLRELHYERIILVVGYCHEMFQRFAAPDVTLVYNAEYEITASMGSLALVKDLIDGDFLLIEGDTFFEKQLLERLSAVPHGNCISYTEESGSGDECYIETRNGFVTKLTKDRHRVCRFEGEMIGVTRLCQTTFLRMIQEWERSSNPYLNYEYLLTDVTDAIDRPCLYFKNLIWGDVDNHTDYHKLINHTYRRLCRKENPFDRDNLLAHLQSIFPGLDPHTINLTKMGGMSNKNFLVETTHGEYVLRVPGNGAEGMVERSNEEFNAIEGCRMGINPTIRYFNAQTGIKLADFIENAETLNAATIQRPDNLSAIARIYRTLHYSRIRLKNEFNVFQEIEKYDRLIIKAHAQMYKGWDELKPQVMELEAHLNTIGVDLKPCHNDAVPENFIKSPEGKLYLIDWEYSGMNDPMADLAALFIESDFSEESKDFLLARYFEGNIPTMAREKILCYQVLWDCLWSQWTVIKEAKGDDFGSYGIDRFERARRNLQLIK